MVLGRVQADFISHLPRLFDFIKIFFQNIATKCSRDRISHWFTG